MASGNVYHKVPSGTLADPGGNGLIKRTALNVTTPAVPNTDYMAPVAGSGLVKVAGGVPALAAANDFAGPAYATATFNPYGQAYATLTPAITAYQVGAVYRFMPTSAPPYGYCSISFNGLALVPIMKMVYGAAVPLLTGDLMFDQMVCVMYDGTYMQVVSNLGVGEHTIQVSLSTADILTLYSAGKLLALGYSAGSFGIEYTTIEFISCIIQYSNGGTAFTSGGAVAVVYYNSSTFSGAVSATTTLFSGASGTAFITPASLTSAYALSTFGGSGPALYLKVLSGSDFAAGNGSATLRITFRIHPGF